MAAVTLTVRQVAERKGITNPHALAERTGLNYYTCYQIWQGGQQRIDLKTLARLCEALGVKPGQLFAYSAG